MAMKQIFDWLREQMQIKSDIIHHNWEETNDEKQFKCHTAYDDTIRMVDEAEAKWEADCCTYTIKNKPTEYPPHGFMTSCGSFTKKIKVGHLYCSYCGKKIKIVEVER